MRKGEKELIKKAIKHLESNDGYFDGILILYDLIGNTAYRKNMELLSTIPRIRVQDLMRTIYGLDLPESKVPE
jgi:mannose/fructose-specific phosphotransferase system component IIA